MPSHGAPEKTLLMDTGPDIPPPARSRLRSAAPAALFGALAALAVSVAVLYGMSGPPGKETAAPDGKTCPIAAGRTQALAAAARGEVAAFNAARRPKPALDIAFLGPDGAPRKLSDFRGRTVLLNLWATWCVPCREEMPALDRLEAKAGGADFEVVAVNIDTARLERRQQFLDEIGVKALKFYADPKADSFQALKRAGAVVGLPTTLLIDADGCEAGALAGAAQWDSEDALKLIRALSSAGT